MTLPRQLSTYALVGAVASLAHYAVLIALVEIGGVRPVPAALAGYVVGGVVSYGLNRRHTFASDRPHREAAWRFALVALLGFGLTYAFMRLFVEQLGAPYLPAQILTTILIMFVSFAINRIWTFAHRPLDP
jgi:putative flippase GtrA